MIPDIDSRLSRNILKSISYGLPLAEVVPDHTYAQLETRLGELKRRYLELRISHGARELPFSNYLFYLILQSRHQEFDFKLRQGNSVVTNINRNPATGETREGFLGKVERQLERIAGALPCPAATCSFFEMCGGEDGWHRAHGEIVQRLEQGDYGQTGLDYPALESIFLSRLPLYEKWFASQSREQIWASFVSQAAEYALMGKLFGERFDNFVVLAVDHYRMEPFYSFFATVPTLYIRTDYL